MTSRFTKTRALALVALVLVFMLALAASAGAADTTTVVNPADIGVAPWSIVYTEAGGSSAIVSGPATPPLGTGSLQMTTGPAVDKRYNMTSAHAGQLMTAITHLSYSTYGDSNLLAPVLQVTIDPDGAGLGVPRLGGGSPVNFATVSFEPYHANVVTPGVWQNWDVLANSASVWASNVAGDAGNGTQANPATWAEFVAFYPNAIIGGFGVNVGKGWSSPFTGATDALKIGYGGDTWTYDFEPVVLCTTVCYVDTATGNDLNGGASTGDAFKTIQMGVTTVQAGGTVHVAAGVYPENVTIAKSLTLDGAGQTNDAAGTVLDGGITDLNGRGITINTGVTDVTIQELRVQNYNNNLSGGIYAHGANHRFTVQNVTVDNNGLAGSDGGLYMNGPVDDVLIDHVTATNNRTRGIVIWNGFKTNITLTNNTVSGNNCCGIELQDGTASGVTATGNTSTGNADSGMSFVGLMGGAGANLIADNTLTNNGRFGLEIKLPNGTGLATGDGSIVIEDNTVSLNPAGLQNNPNEERDLAGIAVMRRAFVSGNNNVDIPTGVIVRNNTVSGYQQNHINSTSTGFGIVIEGTNSRATGNTLNNNDVGVQAQAGHDPASYVANAPGDGNQSDLADDFFGRGNSPLTCATILPNTFSGNGVDSRFVGTAGGQITNVNTGEGFCTIQAAVDDAQTLNGHTISVPAGTYTENVTVHKSLTINGANAGISPNDSVTPLNPNGARGPESVMAMTGGGIAFKATTANVTIDGFKFTDTAVDVAHVQTPLIGAGVNFGGDAPGIKVINNLFYQTNRNLVTFNGPAMMQGGTIDNNRVENPGRPDTGCVSAPNTTPPSACGHQLFNPWRTNNLSFQHNVAFAPAGNRDRVRTINVSWSTNVLLKYNTLRYTCIYTCFSIPLDASPVEVAYNDAVTDAGQVLALHPTWTTGTINAHHNIMTTGADFPIAIDNATADLDNVHINRNAITGTYHARNGTDNLVTPGQETLDVTCNWWGSAAGPNPANFFGPNDFDPWLTSSNLDGPCAINGYLVSAEAPGTTDDNVAYGLEDILQWDVATSAWSKWFDGSDAGLTPNGKAMHNIIATYIPDSNVQTIYMTFAHNARNVPGITGKVDGMDIVKWNGTAFSLYFDGQDVGLTGKSQEKIDAIHFLDPGQWTFDATVCQAYLLISTQGPGQVKNFNGGKLKFSGEDILGFCLTQSGAVTTGKWAMFLDGSTQGMPKQSTSGLSANPAGTEIYITTKGTFNVDTATGTHSMVYVYNTVTQSFSGPTFNATVEGLPTRVDALDISFD